MIRSVSLLGDDLGSMDRPLSFAVCDYCEASATISTSTEDRKGMPCLLAPSGQDTELLCLSKLKVEYNAAQSIELQITHLSLGSQSITSGATMLTTSVDCKSNHHWVHVTEKLSLKIPRLWKDSSYHDYI